MIDILEGSKLYSGKIKKLTFISGGVLAFGSAIILAGCGPVFAQLEESNIDAILTTAFADMRNIPDNACVSLPDPGVKLPGNTETASLMYSSEAIRKDVAALIDAGLITVKFNSAKGPSALAVFKQNAVRNTSSSVPDVSLSYVDLTPLGKTFYRYDDPKLGNFPHGIYGVNRFCAHIQYGGVEKYMAPKKNPFDDNPHLVAWVNFKWKLDENRTPWLKNPVLKENLSIYSSKDIWSRSGILLELHDDGWGLGNEPYIIRW